MPTANSASTRRRRFGRHLSLALKIGIPVVLVTFLVAAIFGYATINETEQRLNDTYAAQAEGLASVINSDYALTPDDSVEMTRSVGNLLITHKELRRIRLFRQGSGSPATIWVSSAPADLSKQPTSDELGGATVSQSDVTIDGTDLLQVIVPLHLSNGVVSVGLYYDLAARNASIASVKQRTAVAAIIAVALELLILSIALYFLVLRPVKRLSYAASAVAEGDYSVRLPEGIEDPGRDELMNVAREFDRMVVTVGARTRQQAAVAELGQHALAGTDLTHLLDETAALIREQLDVDQSAVMELNDNGSFVLRAGEGYREGAVGFAAVDGQTSSQAGYTLMMQEPVIMENADAETRFTPSAFQREHNIVSSVSVIVPGQDRPFGIVSASSQTQRAFTKDDVNFLQSVANVLAAGIERKRSEEQVTFMAHHDELTGLPNRAMFEELLDLALARAKRQDLAVAVLFMDLDNFKLVNDSLGHAAGDELLAQLALRLRDATRDTDLVARQGGDEFLVLLGDVEMESDTPLPEGTDNVSLVSESVAVRIHQALEAPFVLGGEEFYTSASIGISLFPKDAEDGRSLLKNADAAMYRSKKAAPAGYVVYSTEAGDPLGKLSMTTRLRKAVESQNWVLHYQPLVELESGEMRGVEALLRWQDPNGGIIPPGEFIPLAEEMGLIVAIGDWVMEEICRQSRAWREDGLELKISFNLSPRQLWQPEMVEKVLAHLTKAEVDPDQVVIEITESSVMTDPERSQKILWDLHARGIRLAIDDFGTGYSSLSRLKHMPVHTLKIDRSFVMDLPDDEDAGNMVSAIIQLAHSLGMSPLAEGIETREQWEFLLARGCTLGQGYLFSRPVPADEIMALYQQNGLNAAAHLR